jgi:hypothetical protein
MKRILVWLFILSFSVAAARAQDDATQQQINKLNGQIQDLLDAQAVQAKRITRWRRKSATCATSRARPPADPPGRFEETRRPGPGN